MKSKEENPEPIGTPSAQPAKALSIPQPTALPKMEIPKPTIPDVTPKAEPISKVETSSIATPRSSVASEELVDLHRKLIEKEKTVTDLEEKLVTLKQKRAEDKSKLKEFEKLKMQNQQVCLPSISTMIGPE